MLFGELSIKRLLAVAQSKISFAANMTALIGSPETKRMMQTAEMQQPEGQTPTTVFDGLVGNGGAEGGPSNISMLEGLIQGLLLTGTLAGRAHLTSSNRTTRSYYH